MPASTVRKPLIPGALRSVGNQPEPKLIAFSCSENRAASPVSGGPGGGAGGSVRAYGSMASSTIRTWRALARQRSAQYVRTSSGRDIARRLP